MNRSFSARMMLVLSMIIYGVSSHTLVAFEGAAKQQSQDKEEFAIQYSDLNLLLSGSVLEVGFSDRQPASRNGSRTSSTRIKHGNTNVSALEGNRVAFNEFKPEHVDYLEAIRVDLEAVPNFMPLKSFSANEQLAYWLNLHNVAVMVEVAKAYPIKKIKPLVVGKKSVWDNKTMSVAGKDMSIQDIEDYVIGRWNDPLVLYGFFMGTVGGPNIRSEAYTGDNVGDALVDNALQFVNSLRGFKLWSGSGRVSDHYKLGERYFPDFDQDIRDHLLVFARPDTRRDLVKAKSFKIKNYDWRIADMKDGDTFGGGSFNTSSSALGWFLGNTTTPDSGSEQTGIFAPNTSGAPTSGVFTTPAFSNNGMSKISPQTRALIRGIKKRNARRTREGTVTVEEFVGGEGSRIYRKEAKEEIVQSPDENDEKEKPLAE